MPRRDRYHQPVREALLKDGWEITHDPLMIPHEGTRVYLDLAAERQASAGGEKVAIEVKVFGSKSLVHDFGNALGQCELYRMMMADAGVERDLYLALPHRAWMELQAHPTLLRYLHNKMIHRLVFNPQTEEVITWIKQTK